MELRPHMMKIHLQPISGDTPYTLEVSVHAALGDLRTEVCTAISCEASCFALLLNGDEMKTCRDKAALSECSITDNVTLTLVRKFAAQVLTGSADKTAKIWGFSTGACKQTLSGHTGAVYSAVFSGDGSSVLTASFDKTAKIWDCSTGTCKQTLSGHTGAITSAAFSGDGSSVLTASYDETAKIWDCSTGACKHTLSGHTGPVNSAVLSVGL